MTNKQIELEISSVELLLSECNDEEQMIELMNQIALLEEELV